MKKKTLPKHLEPYKWKPGQSAHPAGKPVGCKSYGMVKLRQLLYEHGDELVNIAVELAKAGNVSVLLVLLDKMLPDLKAVAYADVAGEQAADKLPAHKGLSAETANVLRRDISQASNPCHG